MATQTIESPAQRPAADLEALFPGRYLSVTSFKRDGTGAATPLSFVSDGRRLFALHDYAGSPEGSTDLRVDCVRFAFAVDASSRPRSP